ncbi:PEGA domain-containing protein [Tautonia sociabilis]|uniref:PEGA domain-containing protein n=1 Tax=Tautonia sociabilis TaxID=2080755 RepID=A0A432MJY2_9BACT|nr:PEGA domain-containing protein [Tautonia sociabilis]RUL87559.1 PEGA domain-containing protein [Tautonia sociabilis]
MLTRPGSLAPSLPFARRAVALGLTLLALACSGCVERRYTVRTDPPGALVFINGEEAGISPVSVNYEYYGDRRVTIQAEGYQTIHTELPIRAPWWDNALTGFVSENLIPFTLRDEREFRFTLAPGVTPPTGDLIGRGLQLRQEALQPAPPRPGPFRRFFAF